MMDSDYYADAGKPMEKLSKTVSAPMRNETEPSYHQLRPEIFAEIEKELARPVSRYIDLAEMKSIIDHVAKTAK
ncbi:MAG: hypothetical protein ORN98_05030 [Alphaproteobacteria bacterium]|nr:hypothetical protein [Alphaproteobacteria bacterium]